MGRNTESGIRVLSLFDGMGCGRVALDRAGIAVEQYFASEIDRYAMKVCKNNYPGVVHIGNVLDVVSVRGKIDLLIGGSPCQGFSQNGEMKGFEDPRSKLFWEYVRVLEMVRKDNPEVRFLLENVNMKAEWVEIISEALCCDPVRINSSLVSGQMRDRLYWTNINARSVGMFTERVVGGIAQPKGRGILLKDILEYDGVPDKYMLSDMAVARVARKMDDGRFRRVRGIEEKAWAITTGNSSSKLDISNSTTLLPVVSQNGVLRLVERSTAIDANFFKGVDNHSQRTFLAMLKGEADVRFRRLTPLECERAQTLPDGYTEGVSDTQRYKMIGNGWTVDVIAHIFGYL